jgi:uncharacterized protein
MDKKKALINRLKAFKEDVSKDIPLQKLIFFGSRAKGKARKWSDVDLLLVSKQFSSLTFRERATKMYDYWNLNYPVDFLCYTPTEYRKLRSQITIVSEAEEEGIVI